MANNLYAKPFSANRLPTQKAAIQRFFPGFRCRIKGQKLICGGSLTPSINSPAYSVRLEYPPLPYGRISVISPKLHPRAPHLYRNGSLCLVHPQIFRAHEGLLLAKTVLPWTALWFYFYEGWLETGIWYGPEAPHIGPGQS